VNVAVVLPCGTVTLDGTEAAVVLSLDRVTSAPPVGAAVPSVTVPVELVWPPTTDVGLRLKDRTLRTVRVAVRVVAPFVAVMTTEVSEATAEVVTVKLAVVDCSGTVTLVGTVATAVLLLERLITSPPGGAAPVSVTVPVEGAPPFTLVGLSATALRSAAWIVSVAVRATPR
jgi:hypothetical protein